MDIPTGTDREIVKYLTSANFTLKPEKPLLTIMHHIFPHVRDWIKLTYNVTTLRPAEGLASLELTDQQEDLKVLSNAIVLGPAFPGKSCFAQLYQRLKSYHDISKKDHDRILKKLQFNVSPPNKLNTTDEILGHLLARDKDNNYRADVTFEDLLSITELVNSGQMSQWAGALLEQARIAYDGANQQTAIQALTVLPLVELRFIDLGGQFVYNMQTLRSIGKEICNQPYIGLQRSLPVAHRIRNWPRLALVGHDYHIKCEESVGIKTPMASMNFKKRVENFFNTPGQAQICGFVLDALKPQKPICLAMKIGSVSTSKAKGLISLGNEDWTMDLEVLFHLLNAKIICEWRDEFFRNLIGSDIKPIIQKAKKLFHDVAEDRWLQLVKIMEREKPMDESMKENVLVKEVQARLNEDDLLRYTAETKEPLFVTESSLYRFILFLSKVYFMLKRVPLDGVKEIIKEIEELKKDMMENEVV